MPSYVERRSYLQMAKEKPEDIRREQECYRQLFASNFRPFSSVLETFGGAGILRGVFEEQGLIAPNTRHEAWDFSEDCVQYLRAKFPHSTVRQVDSFREPIQPGWDLISADFNSWTFLKFKTQQTYAEMTARIFSARPAFVQLTDSAVNKMHLNHVHYARVFARPIRAESALVDYLGYLSDDFRVRFGYHLVGVTYHANASYLLFRRDRAAESVSITKVP